MIKNGPKKREYTIHINLYLWRRTEQLDVHPSKERNRNVVPDQFNLNMFRGMTYGCFFRSSLSEKLYVDISIKDKRINNQASKQTSQKIHTIMIARIWTYIDTSQICHRGEQVQNPNNTENNMSYKQFQPITVSPCRIDIEAYPGWTDQIKRTSIGP